MYLYLNESERGKGTSVCVCVCVCGCVHDLLPRQPTSCSTPNSIIKRAFKLHKDCGAITLLFMACRIVRQYWPTSMN